MMLVNKVQISSLSL